ncbi:Serine/threonine-protein kinase cbk1 [Fulvia fulva]|uniref:non-specific serine/threonine protein kinase n=1 Tax=Passalora fulva TaxID=5499 RepID=A0A9Q8PGR7_PASFU|nr:Serine/threonine-protein kinase cbk1 [Fulvia fulva]KAK4614105.1 Serine/threonine-protein kinase cbk1 [Fulvia fulva]KAK4614787.1 Serine/threonine-protein kinase cbk1 [Fulvia fulva]UJO22173.1 Serine/threonine-protein kinase cbk1 [Fulvia fulva]WPV20239.1 Serine/threonine-protein kinase cbk1 [Fulvia fulva]WPV35749.1 Serine/threonine-protein kinase cbk1 [Fulvia fulva]
MKWIHRDVKPDNFLISASGHLKISDFGLAFNGHWAHCQAYYNEQRETLLEKIGIKIHGDEFDAQEELDGQRDGTDSKGKSPLRSDPEEGARREGLLNWRNRTERRKLARSVVGTSQYMAPEVVQGLPYDGRCDWWSIAIILYECLYGRTPFYCENRQKTKEAIVNHRAALDFPDNERWARPTSDAKRWLPAPTHVAIELMQQLLTDKEARLSSRQYRAREVGLGRRLSAASNTNSLLTRHVYPNGAEEIKTHKFFHGIPWSQMHMMTPPFVPRVKENQSITKYFEDEKDIVSNDSSSYISIKDKISREQLDRGLSDSDLAQVLGHHYPRWKAERTKIEKHELGLEDCSDDELQRIKEHCGTNYEHWRAERVVEVAEARIEQGCEEPPPYGLQNGGKREQKRARDKMLRDPVVGKQCLELRKKGAFFGYTYRRPRTLELREVGNGRVRRSGGAVGGRPTILPVSEGVEKGSGRLRVQGFPGEIKEKEKEKEG